MSLNAALATAGQSLEVFSAGVQLAGQNIANASTPGYIREKLLLETGPGYRSGSLVLGTGVLATGVQQQINLYLEQSIHRANAQASAAEVKDTIWKQLENEVQELGEADLSTALSGFLNAIQDLAAQPESIAFRNLVVQQGTDLARDFRSLSERVDALRQTQTSRIESLVEEANGLIQQISELNTRIVQLEYAGLSVSDAGSARSERYQALDRLAEILPIRFREQTTGAVDVFSDSDFLVLSGHVQQLEIVSTGTGPEGFRIELSTTKHDLSHSGGELRGLIEGRDEVLGGFLDRLDDLASNLVFHFNRLHSSGEGVRGYESLLSTAPIADFAAPLNDSGLPFIPRHGSFEIKILNQQTELMESTTVNVNLDGIGAETSLNDLQAALDGIANLNATITPLGELRLEAASGFEFRLSNDSSGILAALGLNTFFTGSNAATIGVSDVIAGDPELLAAGQGGGPSDGRNVASMIDFLEQPLQTLGEKSLDGFYEDLVSRLAQDSAAEGALATGFATFRDSLKSQQQQFTGVSLDEEAIRVLEFQRAFQAAARIISTVDELFGVLVNL